MAFKLYDTYGFPLDLTQDALRRDGYGIDLAGFDEGMERQKTEARAAWKGSGEAATEEIWFELNERFGETEFLGYEMEDAEGLVLAIIVNGEIICAAQEERFTRVKHDKSFPKNAIQYCLQSSGIKIEELDKITFYEDPGIKFQRLLYTYLRFFPKTIPLFIRTFIPWLFNKRFLFKTLRKCFKRLLDYNLPKEKLYKVEHHLSHAASAFIPSPYDKAAIVVMDGVGEFASTSIW